MKFIECLQVNKYLLLLEVERRIIFFFFSPIEWFSGKMILLGKPARNFSRKAFFFFFKYVNLSARTSPPPPQSAMWCSFARDIVQDYIVALKRITMAQR